MFHALERLFQKLHTLHPTAVGSPAAVSLLKSFTATALLFYQSFFVCCPEYYSGISRP
jgi:hypothetical protein